MFAVLMPSRSKGTIIFIHKLFMGYSQPAQGDATKTEVSDKQFCSKKRQAGIMSVPPSTDAIEAFTSENGAGVDGTFRGRDIGIILSCELVNGLGISGLAKDSL
jgi:hypothetical protein